MLLATLPDADYAPLVAPEACPLVNIGSGDEVSIGHLAAMIASVVGFTRRVVYDPRRPDGAPRKIIDSARMRALGWSPRIGLRQGLASTYAEFAARASR